jgi:hypothetical protein
MRIGYLLVPRMRLQRVAGNPPIHLSFAFLALDIVRWASCYGEQEKGIGGLSVDEGTADAEPACPACFGQRPADQPSVRRTKLSVTI